MKQLLVFAGMFFATTALAQEGYRDYTRYRQNDPFLFCHEGRDDPKRCWWPVAPYTGGQAFGVDPSCKPPTYPYGRDWTQDDWNSWFDYERICPEAGHKSGEWGGRGQMDMTPFKH